MWSTLSLATCSPRVKHARQNGSSSSTWARSRCPARPRLRGSLYAGSRAQGLRLVVPAPALPNTGGWLGTAQRRRLRDPLPDQLRVRVVVVTVSPDRLVRVVVKLCIRCPKGTLLGS